MRISVKVMGHAAVFYPEGRRQAWEYEGREGETVRDMLSGCGIKSELVMSVAHKGRVIPKDSLLQDGMELIIFTPVSGG